MIVNLNMPNTNDEDDTSATDASDNNSGVESNRKIQRWSTIRDNNENSLLRAPPSFLVPNRPSLSRASSHNERVQRTVTHMRSAVDEKRKTNWSVRRRWFRIGDLLLHRHRMMLEDDFLSDKQRMDRMLEWLSNGHPMVVSRVKMSKSSSSVVSSLSSIDQWRERVWKEFDDPHYSKLSTTIAIVVFLAIGLSVLAIVLESVPALESQRAVWNTIETVTVVIFSLEFGLRVVCCPSYTKFVRDPLNWVDFVAILPFYVELTFKDANSYGSTTLRSLRLVRIFRVFKVSRYVIWVRMFAGVLRQSWQPLLMLGFVMCLAIIFFASAVYFLERGTWNADLRVYIDSYDNVSQFQSIPDAFWWCVITLTTVGYGDMVPITTAGRFIATLACLFGILVLAIPISVISQEFTNEYVTYRRRKQAAQKQLRSVRATYRKFLSDVRAMELIKKDDLEVMRDAYEREGLQTNPLTSKIQDLMDIAYGNLSEEVELVIEHEKSHFRSMLWDLIEAHMDGEICTPNEN